MATASPPAGHTAQPSTVGVRVHRFWRRVTEGLEVSQLWSQFETETRASYQLYSKDVAAKTPEGLTTRGRHVHVIKEFFWAVFEKLSPARRVLLLAALVMLCIPHVGFSYEGQAGKITGVELDLHFWAGLLLLILLMLEIADRVVMKRDLQIAREIQTWLLPGAPPQIPGLTLAYATRPANTVAGDYYDVFPRPGKTPEENRVVFAVADVAGKSIPAAILMATFQASLKTLSTAQVALPELAANMNRYACTNSQGGLRFTTAFLALYDPISRSFDYINAGHNNPILRRASGQIERLDVGGLPFGIQPDVTYASASVTIAPDDWLIIFTDGLVEAVNASQEEYGETRVLGVIEAGKSDEPAAMLNRLMAELDLFVGTTPQHDDVTCMLLKAA
ncbi:Serine phosphatase [Candidatus Sulfotelmatobacter kueseliae]|uniref:Serine phosphatase n=1 Tax=Candidatus Sulfotelmatobacter kueseliae TaxID=2042962 RepID=A0A2U3KIH6_9BACT|nr:Serine phosphatase [Candidatus Sulfotelmatobacter kueseliae]